MALSIPLTAPLTAPGTRTCLSIHSLFGRTTFTRHCRLPHFSASPWLLKNRSSLWGPLIALPQSLTSPHPYPGTYLWGAPDRTRSQERERGQMGKLVARIILVACAYMRVPKG